MTTHKQVLLLIACLVSLPGCDAATQIAGDALEGEIGNAVTAQCLQVAESAGIVAGRVAQVCECTANAFVTDPDLTIEDASPQRIEGIVNQCATETGGAAGSVSDTLPAE
ncbi:hypothetical protein GRI62_03915 [Erythrobacter arachoides]|uniref:Secreted protein n=1 Tax=Aurantiacibacter arachoides TaxID=1850444 RepID=A0A844ZZ75_9SPHN|nr:hypothetical protein [Aurantiacibacter arachoides]MXO92754.1 hypothetical protein [Aurantiacibacter arachoides]GGD54745.1 hypothetical protein GCM10011411_13360 [Aurantiacibacter arachoides]